MLDPELALEIETPDSGANFHELPHSSDDTKPALQRVSPGNRAGLHGIQSKIQVENLTIFSLNGD